MTFQAITGHVFLSPSQKWHVWCKNGCWQQRIKPKALLLCYQQRRTSVKQDTSLVCRTRHYSPVYCSTHFHTQWPCWKTAPNTNEQSQNDAPIVQHPHSMWDEFIITSSCLSTLTASKVANSRTPYELWFGHRPSVTHLCKIGSHAYVLTTGNNPKITARLIEFTFIGYTSNAKAYQCWHWESGRIVDLFHVTFIEHLNDKPHVFQPSKDAIAKPDVNEGVTAPTDTSLQVDESSAPSLLEGMAEPPMSRHKGEDKLPRWSAWNRVPALSKAIANDGLAFGGATACALEQVCEAASWCAAAKVDAKELPTITCAVEESDLTDTGGNLSSEELIPEIILLIDVEDPDAPNWTEALQSDDHNKWIEGAKAELTSLHDMGVYTLIPCSEVPANRSILCGWFICQLKHDEVGNLVHFKVRWVAKGFQQVWGRVFSKTTSPTAWLESLRMVLHIAATLNWCLEQYNVKTVFLNGILPKEEVQYMEQLPGFAQSGLETHVWKLLCGLYGMHQSSQIRNHTLHSSFLSWGFSQSKCEWCVYTQCLNNGDASIVILSKKESQLQSKKTDFSQEKSRKSQFFWLFFDFSLTFLDWNPFFLTVTDFLFYRESWVREMDVCTTTEAAHCRLDIRG